MLIQLPNGLLDGADLFNWAEIDELRGKQQNYLVDRELVVENIGHLPKILEDMVLSLQTKEGLQWKGQISDAIYKLPSGDLETILIKVRENTYGPRFYHEGVCPFCNHVHKNLRLDLDKLELTPMSVEEMLTPKVLSLPKSGTEVELKPAYLSDLFKVLEITKNKKNKLITSILAISIKRLGDKSLVTEEDIAQMSAKDMRFIQQSIESLKMEGSIDTDIETQCTECKKEFKLKLNVYDVSFFDPTRGSPNLNM